MYKKNNFTLWSIIFTVFFLIITSMINPIIVHADNNTKNSNNESLENANKDSSKQYSTFNLADIDVAVTVSNDFVIFTQNVTSNNSYLEKIGAQDVEQLRALMKVNNVYLEIIPKDGEEVLYEILVSGKDAPQNYINFNEMDKDTLESQFQHYVDTWDNISNDSVTETITNSFIDTLNGTNYYVTDVTSVANNNVVIYVRKYYTIMQGKAVSFAIQTNQNELTEDMKNQLKEIVNTVEYKDIKKSWRDTPFYTEILSTILSLLIPILLLALITYLTIRASKKKKRM